METNILKKIFFDKNHNWDHFVKKHKGRIRPVVIKEIEKFRKCGEIRNMGRHFQVPTRFQELTFTRGTNYVKWTGVKVKNKD